MDFIQWWQAADYAAKFTVIGAVAAVIALIVGFVAKTSKSNVVGKNGSVVGNTIKNSEVSTNVTSSEPPPTSEKP